MASIKAETDSPAINIALDTILIGKQALVFCGTRAWSESTAEKIADKVKTADPALLELSDKVLKVLSSPTKQCRRLSYCIKKGIAFHHAGLASGQRSLIEENFKKGLIKIICSTPTLAMGVNLPAFRTIIKDLKRYGGRWGMEWIQTLEYHQMAGRAGRPDFNDKFGEAICIATTEKDRDEIIERFINADPEKIQSKLAVEPVLRTYCLSLLATDFARSKLELLKFFEKTFYAHQFGDLREIEKNIVKILRYLEEWEFIRMDSQPQDDFVSADKISNDSGSIDVTPLGERVAQLYLDPYTAHFIITAMRRATSIAPTEFSFIHLACSTLELRPLSTVRTAEVEKVENSLAIHQSQLIVLAPSVYEPEYDDFLKSIKVSLCLQDWMEEHNEEEILEAYNIPPGELHVKRDLCDWILYASDEIAALMNFRELQKVIRKTRYRLDKGVKEELIPLVRFKNIGRVRARLLFNNGIKDIGDVKAADLTKLTQLLGKNVALDLKKQSGEDEVEPISENKRKGQMSIEKY